MIIRKGIEIQTAQSPQGGRGGDPFGSRNWGDDLATNLGGDELLEILLPQEAKPEA